MFTSDVSSSDFQYNHLQKLAAVASNAYIYTSTDSGVTWSYTGPRSWTSIASSSDGTVRIDGVAFHARCTTQTTRLSLAVAWRKH